MSAKPPVPEWMSPIVASLRRNASTATMMNAADAISAIDITLRDGRNAALRNPRRHTDHGLRPTIGTADRVRSDDEICHMAAASRLAPAAKNIGARKPRFADPTASIATPA